MDIHKPKPVHSLKELATEYGVIVLGILTALGLEQAVESYHTHERTEAAQEAVELEIRQNLGMAINFVSLEECTNRQLVALSDAIGREDQSIVRNLWDASFLPQPAPWQDAAWSSALASSVSENFEDRKRYAYGSTKYLIDRARDYQARYLDARKRLDSLLQTGMSDSPAIAAAELPAMSEMSGALHGLQDVVRQYPFFVKSQLGIEASQAVLVRTGIAGQNENTNPLEQCKIAAAALGAESKK